MPSTLPSPLLPLLASWNPPVWVAHQMNPPVWAPHQMNPPVWVPHQMNRAWAIRNSPPCGMIPGGGLACWRAGRNPPGEVLYKEHLCASPYARGQHVQAAAPPPADADAPVPPKPHTPGRCTCTRRRARLGVCARCAAAGTLRGGTRGACWIAAWRRRRRGTGSWA
eukprot:354255-Chlamydomonas_euryale.AAC.5